MNMILTYKDDALRCANTSYEKDYSSPIFSGIVGTFVMPQSVRSLVG
ncbi:hypothetical protein [Trichormus sp. NMC-1]|nr:hypothetical protein [Trichormus sp. NMC-1]